MRKTVNVGFNPEEIEQRLKSILQKKHENVAEVIMGIIGDREFELNLLLRATLGLFPEHKYKIGDMILVKSSNLPTWRFNEDMTLANSKYSHQTMIKCTIVDIEPYKFEPYIVSFYAVEDAGNEVINETSLYEHYIQGYQEEIPEELLSKNELPLPEEEVNMDDVV